MSFQHRSCGGRHETVQEARDCEKRTTGPARALPSRGGWRGAEKWQIEKIERLLKTHNVPQAYYDSIMDYINTEKLGYAGALRTMDRIKTFPEHPEAPAPASLSNPVTKEGIYRVPETGELWAVRHPVNLRNPNPKRLYACLVVIREQPLVEDGKVIEPAKIGFEYVSGAIRKLHPDWLMTKEEAVQFGALYGVCVKCGSELSKEESIERGMGDICASKQWG